VLCRFVNFYNTVKPHGSLDGNTPFEVLQASLSTCGVNNATISYTFINFNFPCEHCHTQVVLMDEQT